MKSSKKRNVIKQVGAAVGVAYITLGLGIKSHAAEYRVFIENHKFSPDTIEVVAGKKHRLIVVNKDDTAEEFESYELNREKIVAGNAQIVIFLPALDAGTYPFFGEFNEATAQGRLVAK